jgi:hypothetical protein
MKPTVLFLAGAVMLASASTAASQESEKAAAKKTYTVPCSWKGDSRLIVNRYRDCLKSDNQGVVEAALAHILWMRVAAPCVDVTPLKADVERLSVKGKPATIRLRAYLTAMVFENPDEFKGIAQREYEGPNDLFASVTDQMYAADSENDYPAMADGQ